MKDSQLKQKTLFNISSGRKWPKQFSQSSLEHWFPSNSVKKNEVLPTEIYYQKIIDYVPLLPLVEIRLPFSQKI